MKLFPLFVLCMLIINTTLFAQNEGRIGIFAGVGNTSLLNADDKNAGIYLPTFKPTIGVSAGYHFTLFKTLPIGFSGQFGYNGMGQNYRGTIIDGTTYYAYSRLNYLRSSLAFHFGTNPRRQLSLDISLGASVGFLSNYQDRFEWIRLNNDRYILDIKNSQVELFDTTDVKGKLTSAMYNKSDMSAFGTIGMNVLLSSKWVFGAYLRYDMGMAPVENTNKININFETIPASSMSYKPFNVKVKYHAPPDDKIKRAETTNTSMAIYLSLRYRIFNKEKVYFNYKENEELNH